MDDAPPTVAEFVEYCELQAGLLAGHVETMREEADALLDEIDAELASARDQLEDRSGTASAETPPSTNGPSVDTTDTTADDTDAAAAIDALEEKQAVVEAKQARMRAFQALASGYTDLAEELDGVEATDDALERVVTFEAEHDAPAYFERETLLESVGAGEDAS